MINVVTLPRFVAASINKYFNDGRGSYILTFEHQDRPKDLTTWAEVRIEGPDIKQLTKPFGIMKVSINILCTVAHTDNLYSIQDMVGFFASLLMASVPIYDFTDLDNPVLIGCLRQTSEVDTIGLPTGTRSDEKAVECSYEMEL